MSKLTIKSPPPPLPIWCNVYFEVVSFAHIYKENSLKLNITPYGQNFIS